MLRKIMDDWPGTQCCKLLAAPHTLHQALRTLQAAWLSCAACLRSIGISGVCQDTKQL